MLTDKKIEDIALKYVRVCGGYESYEDAIPDRDVIDFARDIEKAVLFEADLKRRGNQNMSKNPGPSEFEGHNVRWYGTQELE